MEAVDVIGQLSTKIYYLRRASFWVHLSNTEKLGARFPSIYLCSSPPSGYGRKGEKVEKASLYIETVFGLV